MLKNLIALFRTFFTREKPMSYPVPPTMRSIYYLVAEYERLESEVNALPPEHVAEYEQFRVSVPRPAFSLIRGIWSARSKIAHRYSHPEHHPYPIIKRFRKRAAQFSLQLALNFNQYQYLDGQLAIKLSRKLAREFRQFTSAVDNDTLKQVIERETLESKLTEKYPELVEDCERFWTTYDFLASFERVKSNVAELSPEWAAMFEQVKAAQEDEATIDLLREMEKQNHRV